MDKSIEYKIPPKEWFAYKEYSDPDGFIKRLFMTPLFIWDTFKYSLGNPDISKAVKETIWLTKKWIKNT